jgi:hypothetical protein
LSQTHFDKNDTQSLSSRDSATKTASLLGAGSFINNHSSTKAKIPFEEGNTFTVFSYASDSEDYAALSGIGASAIHGGTSTAHNIPVNMNGGQTMAAVAHAFTERNLRMNTFSADNTGK